MSAVAITATSHGQSAAYGAVNVYPPPRYDVMGDMLRGVEVVDYVVQRTVDGDVRTLRTQNEAANRELARRGLGGNAPSGEVAPSAVAWVDSIDGVPTGKEFIEEGT